MRKRDVTRIFMHGCFDAISEIRNKGIAVSPVVESLPYVFEQAVQDLKLSISEEAPPAIRHRKARGGKWVVQALGRYVRRTLGHGTVAISDYQLRTVARHIELAYQKHMAPPKDSAVVVDGQELFRKYESGFGFRACMSGGGADYIHWYVENPEVVKMLCLDSPTMQSRALLWHTEDGKFMDRIYPNDGIGINVMREVAKDMGYDVRKHDGVHRDTLVVPFESGNRYRVRMPKPTRKRWPYVDSLSWMHIEHGEVVLDTQFIPNEAVWILWSPNGVREVLQPCVDCGETVPHPVREDGDDLCWSCRGWSHAGPYITGPGGILEGIEIPSRNTQHINLQEEGVGDGEPITLRVGRPAR